MVEQEDEKDTGRAGKNNNEENGKGYVYEPRLWVTTDGCYGAPWIPRDCLTLRVHVTEVQELLR